MEERREILKSGPGEWMGDPSARLPSDGQQQGQGQSPPGQAGPSPSGLALLHLDRPGLDRSGSLQRGSS